MPCRTPLGRSDLDSRSHSLAIPSCGQPLLLLHPFILDPISYVDQGSAEVHAASAREVATSAGDSLSNSSAGSPGICCRTPELPPQVRMVWAWLWACLAWRNPDTKINKVYLNVITHWPRAVVNHRGTPGWSRAPVDPPAKRRQWVRLPQAYTSSATHTVFAWPRGLS